MLADPLAVTGCVLKDQCHRVFTEVEDPCASANAVPFGQCLEHPIDRLFIGVKAGEDAIVAGAELTTAFQTSVVGRSRWPVTTNQF